MTGGSKILGMPVAKFRDLMDADCTRCGTPAPSGGNCPQRDRSVLCNPCIDVINAEIRAANTAARAAGPQCAACARRPVTRILCKGMQGETGMCGTCARVTAWALRASALVPVSWASLTSAAIIRAARTGGKPPKGFRY
jgi:hypothetical protein